MNLDKVIARAVPPPLRVGGPFVPVKTDPVVRAHRRERMVEAFGSREAAEAHAESLGLPLDDWLARLDDVRLEGEEPLWATLFREMRTELRDDPHYSFEYVRKWAKARLFERWPRELVRGPKAHSGFLNYLAQRLTMPVHALTLSERRMGLTATWNERIERGAALAWIFGQVAADWFASVETILDRAARDRQLYSRAFMGCDDPGPLLRVEPGLGDAHEGGNSVAILRFERGSVVYKPKDLRIAVAVGEIVELIGAPGVTGPNMLLRDGYAWEEEQHTAPVDGPDAAAAFYRALGSWLATLQGLAGVDFWFDNLIADGATPRFIDYETAVQPLGLGIDPDGVRTDLLRLSPGIVGILPMFGVSGAAQDPTDMGCLTRPGKHQIPTFLTGGESSEWEESRFAPRLADGTAVDVTEHFDAFEEGYLEVVRALRGKNLQERVLNVLRRTPDATLRVIVADTWTCYGMVRQSLNFGALADGVWREIALQRTMKIFAEVAGSLRENVVADLRRLDVPLFHTHLDSRAMYGTADGRMNNMFALDALHEVPRRLEVLGAASDGERLAWLRSTFSMRKDNPPRRQPPAGSAKLPEPSAGNLREWALEITRDIRRHTHVDDNGKPTWTAVSMEVFAGWRGLLALSVDVLCGRAGLAYALRELAEGLNEPALAELAAETLEGAALDYMEWQQFHLNPGFVVGVGGLVTSLARTPGLRPLAEEVYHKAAEGQIWRDWGGDFVAGLEGWQVAAEAVGEPPPQEHGEPRPYAPAGRVWLAPWLDPDNAAPVCPNRECAAERRRDRDLHGSWFPHRWLDDRHDLSIVNGLPALAIAFLRLANGAEAIDGPIIDYLR